MPENAKVTITARVDGAEIHESTARRRRRATARPCSSCPPQIERGEGTLAFAIEDGGVVETASKTIPILLQTVDLSIYPEGGDLVAGLPCRVYFEARTPVRKPADIAGVVVDAGGEQVGAFRTEHEGRGRFMFDAGEGRDVQAQDHGAVRHPQDLPAARGRGQRAR